MEYIVLICCVYIIYFHSCELEHIFDDTHVSKPTILYFISWLVILLDAVLCK